MYFRCMWGMAGISAARQGVMQDRHKEPSVVFQMELTYEDGTSEMILSDGSETCRTDFIVYSDLYQGEKQDLTLASGEKKPVMIKDYGYDFLHVQPMEPILPIREIPAVEVFTSLRERPSWILGRFWPEGQGSGSMFQKDRQFPWIILRSLMKREIISTRCLLLRRTL